MNNPRNLGFLLKGIARLNSRNFERHARELGLSLPQCKVLVYLSGSEGVSQTRLAEITETDPMTLVRILDRMEQDHWIERRPDPIDRRAHCLYLKNDVKPVLTRIWKIIDRSCGEALEGLSAAERAQLIHLLEHIQQNLLVLDDGERSAAGDKSAPSAQRGKA
jgi:MarR family transcriptional regulator for hemolysin